METIMINEICPSRTIGWIRKGALLLDVREQDEVEVLGFDVPDLKHIPLSVLEEKLEELPKDREMVVVCRNGDRSRQAVGYLVSRGFDAELVVNMKHGILKWIFKGFPVKGDVSSFMEEVQQQVCHCGKH